MRSTWMAVALGSAVAALAACTATVKEQVVVQRPAPPVVRAPPALIVETVPAAPAAGYTWVAGHWVWRDVKWVWVPGHWRAGYVRPMPPLVAEQVTLAPPGAAYWVPGHWKFEGNDWVWVPGHWHH